jgi:hypothetical protein
MLQCIIRQSNKSIIQQFILLYQHCHFITENVSGRDFPKLQKAMDDVESYCSSDDEVFDPEMSV